MQGGVDTNFIEACLKAAKKAKENLIRLLNEERERRLHILMRNQSSCSNDVGMATSDHSVELKNAQLIRMEERIYTLTSVLAFLNGDETEIKNMLVPFR